MLLVMVLLTSLASSSLSNGETDSTLHDARKVVQMRTTVSHGLTLLHILSHSESFMFARSERKSLTKNTCIGMRETWTCYSWNTKFSTLSIHHWMIYSYMKLHYMFYLGRLNHRTEMRQFLLKRWRHQVPLKFQYWLHGVTLKCLHVFLSVFIS
jgi:hypothetical protein